ncbi:MAG: PQQ-dependent sugar dehydrogenase [Chloroflexia bacterium]|nr:PQQ-dependent sugar dehydrogenase [Chloroflexia bacterium]
MKTWRSVLLILMVCLGLVIPAEVAEAEFTNLPNDFDDQLVMGGVSSPTAIAWLPNGTLLAAGQSGQVFRQNGTGATSILTLNAICSGGETGLLGLAVDPEFSSGQRFVYVYYTHHKNSQSCGAPANRANRVSRFTMGNNLTLSGETVLIDNIAARGGNHNGGDLQFGRDGMLYVSVGDSGQDLNTGNGQNNNGNARRMDLLNGKILRVTPEGAIPADNPFVGTDSTTCAANGQARSADVGVHAEKKHKKKRAKKRKKRKQRRHQKPPIGSICGEIFATGLRNPYRIAFDPDDVSGPQRFFITDVGGSAWEEIDNGIAGADYGWNLREGPCKVGSTSDCSPDSRFVEPIHAYKHTNNCSVITGGAFVPDNSNWPSARTSQYLYADLGCDTIFAIKDSNPGATRETFGTGEGASHLAFGPDGALYYTALGDGEVRKIVYTP